ncbi:hypothetical protein [Brucella intermedia]|uniref:hypothetical protein n=1 Tax=Brucella intermedia TaxID=94625 RepID=UPI00158FE18F|nr:hypothetical protein [Brucella intermedia]
MNAQANDFQDEDIARRELVRKLCRTEGVEIAYQTAVAVCLDPKSTSQAKSNASRTLLEMGGMLNRADRNDEKPSGKELHEMTGEELAIYKRQLEADRRRIDAVIKSTATGEAFD